MGSAADKANGMHEDNLRGRDEVADEIRREFAGVTGTPEMPAGTYEGPCTIVMMDYGAKHVVPMPPEQVRTLMRLKWVKLPVLERYDLCRGRLDGGWDCWIEDRRTWVRSEHILQLSDYCALAEYVEPPSPPAYMSPDSIVLTPSQAPWWKFWAR